MLHHPQEAQIDRIGALNDSFYKTPCTLIQSPPTSSLSLKMRCFYTFSNIISKPIKLQRFFYIQPGWI